MTWNSNWPNGNVSVKANEVTGQDNTNYIKATMGSDVIGTNAAGTEDHFWDVDPGLDGHHRFMKSPAFTVGGLPANPEIAAPLDCVWYPKTKTATESTVQQDVQPFFKNEVGGIAQIMQMLGIRAMGVFNAIAAGGVALQSNIVYSHNLALQSAGIPGIVRNAVGDFTITFSTALPSNSYLVLGGGITATLDAAIINLGMSVKNNTTLTNVKSTTSCRIFYQRAVNVGNTLTLPAGYDPLQGWFVIFGG